MARKTRIFVADRQVARRADLRRRIEAQRDMEVVGEAADGSEVSRAAQVAQPDIVLFAINGPGPEFQETIAQLRRASPGARIIVHMAHEDLAHVQLALEAGASEYLPKTADSPELIATIKAVRTDHALIDSSLSSQVSAVNPAAPPPTAGLGLSARELEVLRLLAQGHSNHEIATQIGLSVKTVETYRRRISIKLRLNTRAELYRFALSHHMLGTGDGK